MKADQSRELQAGAAYAKSMDGAVFRGIIIAIVFHSIFLLLAPVTNQGSELYGIGVGILTVAIDGLALYVRKLGQSWWAAQMILFSVYLSTLVNGMLSGGILSTSMPWLAILPIAAVIMSGTNSGILWGAVAFVTVPILFLFSGVINASPLVHQPALEDHIIDLGLLVLSATAAAWMSESIKLRIFRELESAHLQLRQMAALDPLTNTYNRRSFMEEANRQISGAGSPYQALSVLVLDIDHFKLVNDAYGHAIGDDVLVSIVKTCNRTLRQTDIMARFGGEEFIILLPNTDMQVAQMIADRLRNAIETTPAPTDQGPISVTVSIGVASLSDGQALTIHDIIKRADQAMYIAKQAGRNRVAAWSEEKAG